MRAVAVNLAGVVESPAMGATPYRVDVDGRPYVPVGDGGIVLGVGLGDLVTAALGDHVAPGATVGHPDQAARHGLTAFACVGNRVVVRSGAAAGEQGRVFGKRGEDGRLLVWLPDDALERLRPGDGVAVRAYGQGTRLPGQPDEVELLNLDPALASALGIVPEAGGLDVAVRAVVPSRLAGNGIGRPAQQWDVDLAFAPDDPVLAALRLGDLLAVSDLDVRHGMGFRRGHLTIGLVVHGDSPMPGHGPGLVPLLCGPARVLRPGPDLGGHVGLQARTLREAPAPVVAGRAG